MASTSEPPSDVATLVERYLEAKAKGERTGNYRGLASSVLHRWLSWLVDEDVQDLQSIDVDVMRRYAQDLRGQVRDGDLAASTVNTYYATVRACLTWAREDGLLVENPAAATRATKELPEDDSDPDRQYWEPEDVDTVLVHVTERVDEVLDEDGAAAAAPVVRDRALVSVLATTGVRGAEVCRDSEDDRDGRQGLLWKRVDLEAGTMHVLGKSQEWEYAQLPPQARGHLRRHYEFQDPSSLEWPVFMTDHAPSKFSAVREQLVERGMDSDDVEELLEENDIDEVLREHDVVPPALTVTGARTVMKRLCEAADVEIDGGYLKPHGGRRGLGDTLYRSSAELAQSALRHASIETTHEAYSNILASETADEVGAVLEGGWERGDRRDDE